MVQPPLRHRLTNDEIAKRVHWRPCVVYHHASNAHHGETSVPHQRPVTGPCISTVSEHVLGGCAGILHLVQVWLPTAALYLLVCLFWGLLLSTAAAAVP